LQYSTFQLMENRKATATNFVESSVRLSENPRGFTLLGEGRVLARRLGVGPSEYYSRHARTKTFAIAKTMPFRSGQLIGQIALTIVL